MKKFALSFLCLIPFVLQAQNSAPVISNLSVSERVDNSFLVDIYYDLHDADGDAMTVTLKVSNDNGATWNYLIDPGHLSGDFGQGIMSGIGKHIIWDFGAGNTGGFFLQLKFKLTADDGFTPVMGMPCPGLATLAYGGQIYNTVQIGAQCWMRENLNVGVMVNSYGAYYQSGMHNDSVIEKYCYGNISSNCNIYGALYEWNEAMGYTEIELAQGICPTGWHIPSEGEWRTLEGYIDSQYDENSNEWDNWEDRGYDAGGRMKETGSTYWQSPNTGATNEFGFAALPGGHREPWNGEFYSAGSVAYYWSSTPRPWGYAYSRELTHNNKRIARRYNHQYRIQGYSVRCIKTQCNPIPDQANAGPDASLLSGTTHQLQANQPINGSGQWSILSGQGGSISDITLASALITGQAGMSYSLVWTISNQCGSTSDTVNISFSVPQTTIKLGDVVNCPVSNEVIVPVLVSTWNGAAGFSFRITYDPQVVTYLGTQNLNSSLGGPFQAGSMAGTITLSWYSLTPISLVSATLVELRFAYNSGNTQLQFDCSSPGYCRLTDISGDYLQIATIPGSISGCGN